MNRTKQYNHPHHVIIEKDKPTMLIGERVILRALELADLPLLHAFNNDLEVEIAGGGDPPMPQSLAHLEAEFNQKAGNGGRSGMDFAIIANETFIGICALFNEDRLAGTTELGITIGDRDYWGNGYGREAIGLLVHYGFHYQNYRKIWLRVHSHNERAIKAYQATGFIEEGRLREHVFSNGGYDDLIYMGLLRANWHTDH